MTQEEIIEGNRLIAEFMGLAPVPMSNKFGWSDMPHFSCIHDTEEEVMQSIAEYAKYRTSWDWLMPVVESIENFTVKDASCFKVQIWYTHCEVKINFQYMLAFDIDYPVNWQIGRTKIEATYAAVVEFIKWYNQNYKHNEANNT